MSVLTLAGCGGSGGPAVPTIPPARTFALTDFSTGGPLVAGRPARISFAIRQPSGAILTAYRRGAGPHTGVHLLIARDDLSSLIHRHPPVATEGRLTDEIVFPSPGRYRVVVDAYPSLRASSLPNLQLFRWLRVGGTETRRPLPPPRASVIVDGYRFTVKRPPLLRAIQPAFLDVAVTRPDGRPASFTPWFGALAHAIFFRAGTLSYVHTHVCAPGATSCTTRFGGPRVVGTARPGQIRVGVLVPVPGTWRLFLQCRADGRLVTAPFTLRVR
jgi:hypothetical protein